MSVPGPSARYVYLFDPTASLGINLTGTDGQAGEFNPPAINTELQDVAGSASQNPVILPTGYESADEFQLPIWADSALQGLLDDLVGVTEADRRDARLIVVGWYAADAIGTKVDFGKAYLKKVAPITPRATLSQVMCTFQWDGIPYTGGLTLHALTARTADGDTKSSSQDNAAASSSGGWGAWGYTTYTADGATGLAPRVIDSTNNSVWTALITFSTVTATTGGGQVPTFVSGTVKRYIASDWDFTGTPGAGTTAAFWIAFKRL